jgi:prevent-host-death family protein
MAHTMSAAEFKTKCLQIMDRVATTGEPVVVTKRGRPVAQLAPVTAKPRTLRGFLKGSVKTGPDVVRRVGVIWDAER